VHVLFQDDGADLTISFTKKTHHHATFALPLVSSCDGVVLRHWNLTKNDAVGGRRKRFSMYLR